jgi:ligand-binding sensor domain-containing protein/signal transduction histidine kinase
LCVAPLLALSPALSLSQYAHDTWSRHDGLPSSGIQCIAQTDDGYIWLGTTAGLVRFDGLTFTPISTDENDANSSEPIQALCPGPDNSLWIGTRSNGIRLLKSGRLTTVDMGNSDPSIQCLLLNAEGKLLFGTATRLYQLGESGKHLQQEIRRQFICGLSRDSKGRMWVCTHGSVEYLEKGDWKSAIDDRDLISACLLVDSRGTAWIGTSNHLSSLADGKIKNYGKEVGLLGANIMSLYEDRNKDLWVGSAAGLHRFKEGLMQPIGNADRIPLKNVAALMEDREGSLWVGTDEGLHRFKDVKLVPWTTNEGIIGNLTPSVQATPDGGVYIFSAGDPNGVTLLKNGKATCLDPLFDGPSCVGTDGSLWVVTMGTIVSIKDGQVTRYGPEAGVPGVWISSIIADGDGFIITPINNMGLRRWKPGKLEFLRLADGRPFTSPFHVQSSRRMRDGSICLCTFDGLWKLKDGKVTRYIGQVGEDSNGGWYRQFPQSPTCFRTVIVPGMDDHWITALNEDSKGVYWLASQRGGLIRFFEEKAFTFDTKEGLFSNQAFSVEIDERDDLWISCPRGIFRVSAAQLNEVGSGRLEQVRCEVFTSDDGMKIDECMHRYQPTSSKSPDGTLWFATKQGVVSVRPSELRRNTNPPPVLIEGLMVDGKRLNVSDARLEIAAGTEKVDFIFTALSMLVPERVHFMYRLEGYDADWVESARQRTAHYTRLPPGNYTFRVIACNNDGIWNYQGATMQVKVHPYFHQTIWFLALCVLGCAGLVFAVHRARVSALRARERQLQQRVDERTAELSLANQSLKREMVERVKAEQEVDRVHKQLMTASHQAGMAEMAAGVLHNIGNVLNSVNVSASVMGTTLRNSRLGSLAKLCQLIRDNEADLPRFFSEDKRARQVPPFLHDLSRHLGAEQAKLAEELDGLQKNVDHIKDIVAMQQTYASVSGVVDTISPAELVEDALRMHQRSLERHHVQLVRDFEDSMPPVEIEKHKVLQILVNLIQNAKQACDAAKAPVPTIRITLRQVRGMASISVLDNGIGIPPENMERIFNHGFTTKKDGHGFGLHSSALAAKSIGGSLRVESEGTGKGACFILEIPLKPLGTP